MEDESMPFRMGQAIQLLFAEPLKNFRKIRPSLLLSRPPVSIVSYAIGVTIRERYAPKLPLAG